MKRIAKASLIRKISTAGAVLSVALVSAACGSSASSTTAATATTSAAPISITIGDPAIGAGYTDIYVGILDGIFKKNGLNVTLARLNTDSQVIPAIVGGSVQIGVTSAVDSAAAILKGIPLQFIAMSETKYNLEMWGDASIKSVSDLVGKKVALTAPGAESDFALTALLAENHIPNSSVQRVYVGSIPAQLSALESGSANVTLTVPPQGTQMQQKGFVKIADLSNLPFALGTYTVTSAYAKANPIVLQRFANAEVQIMAFIQAHPNKTIAAIVKDSGVSSPTLAKYAYNFFLNVFTKTPLVQAPLVQTAFQTAAAKAGKPVPSNIAQYINNTYVQKALKSAG